MPKIAVTIHTTPQCVQCNMTKREMDKLGIEYSVIDLSTEPEKLESFKEQGFASAPIVTTDNQTWSGFRVEEIRNLAKRIESMRVKGEE